MSLRFHLIALAITAIPAGFLWAQNPVPLPVEPAPVKQDRPKQDKPVPVPAPVEQDPAKKKVVDSPKGDQAKPGATDSKKPANAEKGNAEKGNAEKGNAEKGKADKSTAKKTGKTEKEPEPGEMKKVTININTKDVKDVDDVPLPEGANEEDIRAIRGANAMLKAEKQLKQILKNLKVKGDAVPVPFSKIDSWTYEDGFKGMPKDIRKLDGKRVVMAGFMLPIYEVENIKSFYLVKSLWSCCYGIPPDVNGLVHVVVKKKGGVNYQYDPIFIVGTFKVKEIKDEDYTVCLYEIVADDIRVLDLNIKYVEPPRVTASGFPSFVLLAQSPMASWLGFAVADPCFGLLRDRCAIR
jgi:hypothetical protein